MASTIALVREAIVEALEADEGALKDVTIARHREPTNQKDYVWLYKTKSKRDPKLIGPQPVKLEENLRAFLRVVSIRNKPEDAEDRAEELADAVEDVLSLVKVGAPVLKTLIVEDRDEEPLDFDQKAGHHVLLTVSTQARI